MRLPPIPNLYRHPNPNNKRDVDALYEYLGRLVASLEARVAALEARVDALETP